MENIRTPILALGQQYARFVKNHMVTLWKMDDTGLWRTQEIHKQSNG